MTEQQLDCALDLMRRLPPQQIEKNLSDLIDLVGLKTTLFQILVFLFCFRNLIVLFRCPSCARTCSPALTSPSRSPGTRRWARTIFSVTITETATPTGY